MNDEMHDSESEGILRDLEGNTPLVLNDPDRIWLVGSGGVDVFASHVTNGEPDGARIHLFRVKASQVLFGIRPNPLRADMALLAVGLPGTRVVTLNRERLIRLTEVLGFSGDALAWVDNWIAQLSQAIAQHRPPGRYFLLEPGQNLQLDEGCLGICPKGTMWVRQRSGMLTFMDRTELNVTDRDEYFPVPQHMWVRAIETSTFDVIDTETCLRQDPDWANLEAFHNTVLQCVIWNTDEAVRRERDRLRQRAAADRVTMEAAVTGLADVLESKRGAVAPSPRQVDALQEACRLVASVQDISTQAPPPSHADLPSVDPVRDIARASGFRVRNVMLWDGWWRSDAVPMLAFAADDNRPIALLPAVGGRYEAIDPARGERQIVSRAVAATLSQSAFCFYRPLRENLVTARRLLAFGLHRCGRDLLTVACVGLLGGLLSIVVPVATGLVFDSIIPGADRRQLMQLAFALSVAAFSGALFELTRNIAILRVEGRVDLAVQAGIWDRLLNLPVSFFRRYSSGDLANRAMGVDEIRHALTGATVSSIVAAASSIFGFGLLFYYDLTLGGLAAALLLLAMLVATGASYAQIKLQKQFYDIAGQISGTILEFVTGIAKLRVAGAEHRAFSVWAESFARQKRVGVRVRAINNRLLLFFSLFRVGATLALFAVVAAQWSAGLSTGEFLAFYAAFGQCLMAVLTLGDAMMAVLRAAPLYERTRPILETPPEVDVARADPGELTGAIEISHVSFRYRADGPLILNDVSLQIRPGEFIAVVGPSGAGKSTIMRMLLGFEKPETGSIFYDGQDLSGLDLQAVRRRIGVVLQNSKLIPGDILSNIVGSSTLTIDDAWEAARRAGLEDDIKAMPMGMHTVIGEGGATFSGGQRQRLMIARAIVARPRILLFDEATSALDNRTQAVVSKSLEQLQATRIVIAHRLSTIRNADRIYVIHSGRVAQQGTYEELMKERGIFADLARRQLM